MNSRVIGEILKEWNKFPICMLESPDGSEKKKEYLTTFVGDLKAAGDLVR